MTPIHELLNRIRWDPDFDRGNFELGYLDRVEGRVIVVPFREVEFSEDDPQAFRLVDAEGRSLVGSCKRPEAAEAIKAQFFCASCRSDSRPP